MTATTTTSESVAAAGGMSTPDRTDVMNSKHTMIKRQESSSSPSPSSAASSTGNNMKATDETLSTTNCDDSLTATSNSAAATGMTQARLYAPPPVTAVNVDRRNVRQRLRDQEAKINALLHSKPTSTSSKASAPVPAASEGVLLQLIQTLEADLKKAQEEKQELQDALDFLHAASAAKEDSSTIETEEAETTTEDVMVVQERMVQLEMELRHKTHEAALLQDRWETTVRRMVQYQVDLETHDLHYTDYAAQQFQLGNEALKELKGLTRKDQPAANRQLGKKAKHMMSTLLKDLEVLGERYKDSRVNQEQQVADLRIAQLEWQRRAEYLETICQQHSIEIVEEQDNNKEQNGGGNNTTATMSGPLMKFHQKLRLQQSAAMQNQRELQEQAQACQQQCEQANLQRNILQKEVERLKQTVSQLQNATKTQQDALENAQQAVLNAKAAAEATAVANANKKRKGWFMKKKKLPPPPPPKPLARVDITAALVPQVGESQRFDMLYTKMEAQSNTLQELQQDYQRMARQKSQLQQTVNELRVEQEQNKVVAENRALQEMQSQMDLLEQKRQQEQQQSQATIEELRARLAALEGKEEKNAAVNV